ncbi:response regulator in two-component regulatory system with PhoQ [hydrothermal vent metagenome]|uniref:Response regulator in two-component regulatory system with PhoQ n=1 Tax=hydrothermal vent metagenome TaxID=652676 RepID=A0A3B0VW28_9ZZZZ
MKLLLIEDEPLLVETIQTRLAKRHYLVDVALDGEEAEYALKEFSYDLILLDLGLPKRPGLIILEALRKGEFLQNTQTPVLILTARNSWQERVEGLKKGADDYLGKPFHYEELLARIEALLRRKHAGSNTLSVANVVLNLETKQLHTSEQTYNLTLTEFRLAYVFLSNPDKVFSKEALLARISDQHYDRESNVIEVYIRKLRKMMGKQAIETLRGLGYRFFGEQHDR